MPQEPKKRHSRQRQGKRRAHIKLTTINSVKCPNCGNPVLPHNICKNCGYYKGKEVLKKKSKEKKEEKEEKSA